MSNFVSVYSADVNTAYDPADRLVLARVPQGREFANVMLTNFSCALNRMGTSFGHIT